MKDENNIWHEISNYLAKESDLHPDPSEILESTDLREDLNFDSLQAATMLMDLEDQFDIRLEADFMKIRTVGDIYTLILETKYGKLVS